MIVNDGVGVEVVVGVSVTVGVEVVVGVTVGVLLGVGVFVGSGNIAILNILLSMEPVVTHPAITGETENMRNAKDKIIFFIITGSFQTDKPAKSHKFFFLMRPE